MFSTIYSKLTTRFIPNSQQTIEQVYPCLVGQRERNEARIKAIIEDMGTKWILHPTHTKKRLKTKRPV